MTQPRQPAGIPVGGEFATGPKAENADLVISVGERRAQIFNARIDGASIEETREALCALDRLTVEVGLAQSRPGSIDYASYVPLTLHNPRQRTTLRQDWPTGSETDKVRPIQMLRGMLQGAEQYDACGEDIDAWMANLDFEHTDEGYRAARAARDEYREDARQLVEFLGDDYHGYVWGTSD